MKSGKVHSSWEDTLYEDLGAGRNLESPGNWYETSTVAGSEKRMGRKVRADAGNVGDRFCSIKAFYAKILFLPFCCHFVLF